MKKLMMGLTLALFTTMTVFGQTYSSLWKQVMDARVNDLPETEQQVLRKIAEKAERERDYGQLLKARLSESYAMCTISGDSLEPAVKRIEVRAEQTGDPVLKAIYHTVLGSLYENNSALGDNHRQVAADYFDKALQQPALLASVKATDYEPFVVTGSDSRFYGDDLLSLIGSEAGRYDVLRTYYSQSGNRHAALLSTLAWLKEQRPDEQQQLNKSAYLQRIDSLISVYADLPEAGEAALERFYFMDRYTDATTEQKMQYINYALQQWGSWQRMNELRNRQRDLTALQFNVRLEKSVNIPDRVQTVTLANLRGLTGLTMKIYKVSANGTINVDADTSEGYKKLKSLLTAMPELTQTRTYMGHAAYEQFEDSLILPGLPAGVYMLEFESTPGTQVSRELYFVSNVRVMAMGQPLGTSDKSRRQMRYVVVDATTGQPLKDAKVRITTVSGPRDQRTSVTRHANQKGEVLYDISGTYSSYEAYATTDGDSYCPPVNTYGHFSIRDVRAQVPNVEIYTDRQIYRPGQTVQVAAICYTTYDGYEHKADAGKEVKMTLRDANYSVVAEQTVSADDYGTCHALFTLPSKSLTGRYSVSADGGHYYYFRVEEYKRPAFEVEIPAVSQNYEDGDTLAVKGTARSYAGVPVQNARVTYKVVRRRAFWWMSYSSYWNQGVIARGSDDDVMMTGETMTDADGTFTMDVPVILPKTRYTMFYNFEVTAQVTDQAGETHEGQLNVPLGNRKTAFSVTLPKKVLAEKDSRMAFHQQNAAGVDMDAVVQYRFDNGKWQEAKTNVLITIPKMKSGSHTLEAVCQNDTIEETLVVFSLDDRRPAVQTDDWFFVSDSQFPYDGTPVTVQVGSSDKDVHIVYALMAGNKLIESGAIDKSNELLNRKLTYKDEYGTGLLLTFAWMKEGVMYHHETAIKRPVRDKTLRLQWQTFRNRLEPGQKEEWTMTVVDADGKPAQAQLMAVLYDKSLDQLAQHQWTFVPYVNLPTPSAVWTYGGTWGQLGFGGYKHQGTLNVSPLDFSHFDHDIYPFAYTAYGYHTGAVRLRSRANAVMMYDAAAPTMEKAIGSADWDEATADEAEVAMEESADQGADSHSQQKVQVRENLNETAFFYPQLTTDGEGRVAIKFTLPESLTTWRFMGIAHTQDMMHGLLTDEAVARKEVMIQPNMPRFVRMGDKATITARIFNTSDKPVSGTTRLVLIDPETDKLVSSSAQQVTVEANSTGSVTFTWQPRDDSKPLLIAKVLVSGKTFSDGEQHYLPVLPNRERVTVTVPFTQNEPGTKVVDLKALVPDATTNTQLTVEYTNNPAWLMIQALPVIGHPHDNCALCQASAYYSNVLGRHIIQQNPQAKNVFEQWSREDAPSSSLSSQLSKNQELKDLVLEETPWVAEANAEQDQRQRLADFFDGNMMDQRIDGALNTLRKLQSGDGSWSWWPDMPGSAYMTIEISEMLVRLNQMAGAQDETSAMLDKAFKFMGKEMVDMVAEMKKEEKKGNRQAFPSHKALQWLYICAIDGRLLPSDVRSANDYLKDLLKKETRNQSIYDKAMSAIVLNNKTYVKSLKEYTVYKEEMGRYYDTHRALYSWRNYRIPTQVAAIEAMQRLTPEDKQTIEEMQRWLLQEKRTQAWDTPVNSVDAIYAFLNENGKVNSEKFAAAPHTILKVDGKEIDTSGATAGIGYVKTAMDGDGKQTFTAEKTSTGTSWGAVYMQFMQPTAEIQDQNSGIKVKREILTSDLSPLTSHLSVGDRVKVRITIEADRDYDFVQVVDKRAACMEPVNQLSGYRWGYYCTPKDCSTNYYFNMLSKGKHVIETEYYIDRSGTYETGTCTAGCAYSPEYRGSAKSQTITVE